jgi:predicted dehydrogenase
MPKPSIIPVGTASSLSRRHFIKYSAATATVLGVAPAFLRGQNLNDRVNIAVIGAGGKGSGDTDDAAKVGGNIVGLCDVDRNTLDGRGAKYPQAKLFQDYRKMLEQMEKEIDAVIVATPDHVHAVASTMAMAMGKHCFCQKPLTHSVAEARRMRQLAKEKKVATQMGNQGSAGDGLRRAVEVIQAGVIGKPTELHVWSNRPIWPQGVARPEGQDTVPAQLDWDLWLGPAPFRPYKEKVYHTFAWRGWKDFGTGALGDMACHTVNMPFRALKLGYPNVVECESTSDYMPETYPKSSRIRFEFPEREGLPPLKFWWYDGSPGEKSVKILRPNEEVTKEIVELRGSLPASGALIIGDKGKIFSPDDYGSQFFILAGDEGKFSKGSEHEACKAVEQTIPRSPGHYKEWIDAIRGGAPAYSNFDVAAYLTEIILLGCVALNVGVGEKLDWDGPNMKARNNAKASRFVRREYRKGWKLS